MIRRPPRSTLFPSRRSSDLVSAKALIRKNGLQAEQESVKHLPAHVAAMTPRLGPARAARPEPAVQRWRSEEHTSELQSRQYLVCRLLLEKKTSKPLQYILHH